MTWPRKIAKYGEGTGKMAAPEKKPFNYDKRKFIEMCSVSLGVGSLMHGNGINAKQLVNKACELWDEIEHQYPNLKERD